MKINLKNALNFSKGTALLMSLFLSCQLSAQEAVNLLDNPSAETQIAAAKCTSEINFNYMMNNDFLDIAENVPEGWGAYLNGETKVKWGSSDKEFHSGKYSCFMTLVDPLKSGADHYDCILLGKSNGYSGDKAIKVETGTSYKYSFWIKGDVEKISLRLFTWNTEKAEKESMKAEGLKWNVTVTGTWTQIEGTFTPKEGVKKMVFGISIGNAKTGQSIFVDDGVISAVAKTVMAPAK